jgi:hypothetical protein
LQCIQENFATQNSEYHIVEKEKVTYKSNGIFTSFFLHLSNDFLNHIDYLVMNGKIIMDDKLTQILKKPIRTYFKVLSQIFSEQLEKTTEHFSQDS